MSTGSLASDDGAEIISLFEGRKPPKPPKPPKPRYRSPDGTFEVLLKSALEDVSISDAARSVLFYAATKKQDWVLVVKAIARDMNRPEERVRLALRELRSAGYVSVTTVRSGEGTFQRRVSTLNRHKVVKAAKS